MALSKLIAFDRPLSGAVVPGATRRVYTETEMNERTETAYRRGVDSTRENADQQMVEFRHDMEQLSDGVLKKLSEVEATLLAELREALPVLAVEISKRLLSGYEPPAEIVAQLCLETLEQLYPEREGLELSLSERDTELLNGLSPEWLKRYPNLRIRSDSSLQAGDCQVRSRFGLTDARQSTKLATLSHHLTGA